MKQLPGTPFFLGIPLGVLRLDPAKTGVKTAIVNQLRAPAVVGVTVFDGIAQHNIGLVSADVPNQLALMRLVVLEKAIGHAGVFAYGHPHNAGSVGGLLQAAFGGTPGT
jgi:hypothetical protein